MADPGGEFGITARTKHLWCSVEWRFSDQNALLFGAYRSWNGDQKYSEQCFIALNFRICVSDFYRVSIIENYINNTSG